MTDRELLELAAKAAGLDALWGGSHGMQERRVPNGEYAWVWNPLTSDGDALRLAVKLCMDVQVDDDRTTVFEGGSDVNKHTEDHGSDPSAATRRAITRAAAAIGAAL